jgi:hypothetical protein
MGLDLLPILPCALPSGSAVAIVSQRARTQQHCLTANFFFLSYVYNQFPMLSDMHKHPFFLHDTGVLGCL